MIEPPSLEPRSRFSLRQYGHRLRAQLTAAGDHRTLHAILFPFYVAALSLELLSESLRKGGARIRPSGAIRRRPRQPHLRRIGTARRHLSM